MTNQEKLMEVVIELAKKGRGHVSPNPLVGCLVIKDNEVISSAYHEEYGGFHAERLALMKAEKEQLEGAELYVNLEPCCHHGKTPPCTDIIIESKIKKVYIGSLDPNPLVAGEGVEVLKNAGIEVEIGILEERCNWLNRFFFKHIGTGMPYVIVKAGMTLDGFLTTSSGQSKWITGPESRKRVHRLRSEIDTILVGKNTAIIDQPRLTVREVEGRDPKKIILDSNLEILYSITENIEEVLGNAIIFCLDTNYDEFLQDSFAEYNSELHPVGDDGTGKLNLPEVLRELGSVCNYGSLLIEGGATINSSFLREELVDELNIFQAPIVVGQGKSIFEGYDAQKLETAERFKYVHHEQLGDDIFYQLIAQR
jgi:diaminohydroxyphosphoribosylaminopyrimidine deaminase/5-amino-6-(5-phosphoribosylamino)uracil reductase